MTDWLVEEGSLDPELALVGSGGGTRFRGSASPAAPPVLEDNLAVFLRPLVVRETRKWFGEAEIRLDALVLHGGAETATLFHPRTFRFPRVADGDDLADQEKGLMVYYGKPAHFLVLGLIIARDTRDSDDLAALLQASARSDDVSSLLTQLAAAASPHVAAVQAAMQAALVLGDVAYKLVRQVSPKVLGLYRANWLGGKDNFGVGRHPGQGVTRVKDFEFAYDVVVDRAP